jgi:heat shock protein HslJ
MRSLTLGCLLVVTLVAAGCGDDDSDGVGSGNGLAGRVFISQRVEGHDLVAGTEIRLEFTADEVRATAGCNHLFGQLVSTGSGRLEVSDMGGTEMGCDPERHDQDRWLTDLLTSRPSWSLDGNRLVISTELVELALLDRVEADPDRALEGTRWVVDTIYAGSTGPDGSASSVPGDAKAFVVLAEGRITGSTGCNELSGSYRIDGASIAFDELVQTDMACEPATMVLEDAVVAVLGQQVDHSIVAGRLTLTAPDGHGLGLRADE